MKNTLKFAAIALALGQGTAMAEVVNTTDGNFTVIESVAPLGNGLSFVNGGDGLIGSGGNWPTLGDTPANRAFAMENYDHTWLQYDPSIVMKSAVALTSVFAIPGVDHGPSVGENLEFIIWGSNDARSWDEGHIINIYRDGFDTANTALGHSDDYTSAWGFGGKSYNYFMVSSGDHLAPHYNSTGEGEIDALAAPVPEPETYGLLALGLGFLAFQMRRRNEFA